jgi:hypothetical protein
VATVTPKYGLRKPDPADLVNVSADIGGNMDLLDAHGHIGTYVAFLQLAAAPDLIIFGTITRDANEAVTSAPVVWPDASPGTFTATVLSSSFPGAVDAYTVTYGSPVTRTYTQPTMTRDSGGAVTARPAIVVT